MLILKPELIFDNDEFRIRRKRILLIINSVFENQVL